MLVPCAHLNIIDSIRHSDRLDCSEKLETAASLRDRVALTIVAKLGSLARIVPTWIYIAGEVRDERQGEDRRHRRGRGPHHGPDLHDRGADGHERSPEHGDQELGGGDREESGSVRCWRTVHEQLFHLFNRKQSYFVSQVADKDWNFVVRYEDVV